MFDPPGGAAAGDPLQLRGRPTGRGRERDQGRQLGEGLRTGSVVPYTEVLADYADVAARTVERDGYPVRLRGTVREYFDRLGGSR